MNISLVKGEQFPIEFELRNPDDTIITSSLITEITITCRKKPIATSPILFQKKYTDGDITFANDKYTFIIEEDDTKDLGYGDYGYDIKVETTTDIINKFVGTITIRQEYTWGYAEDEMQED